MKADHFSGAVLITLGLLAMFGSINLGVGTLGQPGPGFLSFTTGGFIFLMALIITFRPFLRSSGIQNKISTLWQGVTWRRPVVICLVMLGYIVALERVGFLITSFLMLLIMLRGIERLPWKKALLIPGLTLTIFYLLFELFFRVTLPRGFLDF